MGSSDGYSQNILIILYTINMIDLTQTKVEEFIMTVQTPYRYDVVGSFKT